ncbi:Concanavalin A-like lectin/glucanase [Gracilaria domingensis]|nr:Concanavalin A-like lectin/glucanase [Gracilaria domingensis]
MMRKGGWIAERFPPVAQQDGAPWVQDVGNHPSETQLAPLANYNPENADGKKYPPPQIVRDQLAPGYEFARNEALSIELNVQQDGHVNSEQLSHWTTDNAWSGRFPAMFFEKNTTLRDNCVVQSVNVADSADRDAIRAANVSDADAQRWLEEGRDVYDTTFVRSKAAIRYGYVEIACSLGDSALSSAFWLKEHGGLQREPAVQHELAQVRGRRGRVGATLGRRGHGFEQAAATQGGAAVDGHAPVLVPERRRAAQGAAQRRVLRRGHVHPARPRVPVVVRAACGRRRVRRLRCALRAHVEHVRCARVLCLSLSLSLSARLSLTLTDSCACATQRQSAGKRTAKRRGAAAGDVPAAVVSTEGARASPFLNIGGHLQQSK